MIWLITATSGILLAAPPSMETQRLAGTALAIVLMNHAMAVVARFWRTRRARIDVVN